MGLILDTEDELMGLEIRRESIIVLDLKRKYPHEIPGAPEQRTVIGVKSEHIFAAADGEIEISKEFLAKLVNFFDKPENRKYLED